MEEKIKIKNTLGENIAAVIHKPTKETEKLAILCTGFLDFKDYKHLVLLAEELVKKDFTVVRFDPTGTWESEGSISDYSTTQYLKDVKSVIDYMMKNGSYTFALLGGHSMGGYISMLYASKDERISVVIDIMGSYSINRIGQDSVLNLWEKNGFRKSSRDIPNSKENKEFIVPFSFAEDRLKYNVLDIIKEIKVPILFIVGEKDTTVLPEDIKLIFDKANDPKKYILIPEVGHNYRHNDLDINKVNKEIINNLMM
jgi:hypothetical protein